LVAYDIIAIHHALFNRLFLEKRKICIKANEFVDDNSKYNFYSYTDFVNKAGTSNTY
jgi:hypothetical protein